MKKTLIIIAVLILALIIITNWRWQKLGVGDSGKSLFRLESFGLNPPGGMFPGPAETREFMSPDGQLKIQYPGSLAQLEDPEIKKALVPENLAEKYNLEILFLASEPAPRASVALVVYKGELGSTIQGVFEKIKEINQKQSLLMELISSDFREREGVFEAKYQSSSGDLLRSKEKMLLAKGNEAYLVSFVVSGDNWPQLGYSVDKIMENAILVK